MSYTIQLLPNIEILKMDNSYLTDAYLVKHPDGRQLQISRQLYVLMMSLQKPGTLNEVQERFHTKTGQQIGQEQLTHLIETILTPQGLLLSNGNTSAEVAESPASWLELHFKRTLISETYLEPLTDILKIFFSPLVFIMLLPFIISAQVVMFLAWPFNMSTELAPLHWLAILLIASNFWHEFGHLAACRRWSCEHGPLGIGLYFFLPAFYVDVSDAWKLSRRQRVIVDLGGIYFHLLFTIGLLAAYAVTRQPVFLWGIFLIDIAILINLNPLGKFDGYWLLSDLIGLPNLHKRTGELFGFLLQSAAYYLRIRESKPQFKQSWSLPTSTKVIVALYTSVSILLWPIILVFVAPSLFGVLTNYIADWRQSAIILIESLLAGNVAAVGTEIVNLLFPLLIVANLAVLGSRLIASSQTYFTRRIQMNERTRFLLLGGGIGLLMTLVAVSLTLFIIQPNFQAGDNDIGGLSVNELAPNFDTVLLDGTEISLDDYVGRPIYLKFWSPDCIHCVEEMPVLQTFYDSLDTNMVFLAVAANSSADDVEEFVSENQITLPILLDESGDIMRLYNITSIPFTYYIDADGAIQQATLGSQTLNELQESFELCGDLCQAQSSN